MNSEFDSRVSVRPSVQHLFFFPMLPGRYQELDLFIKVLRLLCPNLTDAPEKTEIETETAFITFRFSMIGLSFPYQRIPLLVSISFLWKIDSLETINKMKITDLSKVDSELLLF